MGPFEVEEVPDEGQELVIVDVESGELGGGGGVFLLFRLPMGALLALVLVAFLFGWAPGGRLVVLGCYHNHLRSGPDVIFQHREFIHSTIQFLHGYWGVQG